MASTRRKPSLENDAGKETVARWGGRSWAPGAKRYAVSQPRYATTTAPRKPNTAQNQMLRGAHCPIARLTISCPLCCGFAPSKRMVGHRVPPGTDGRPRRRAGWSGRDDCDHCVETRLTV